MIYYKTKKFDHYQRYFWLLILFLCFSFCIILGHFGKSKTSILASQIEKSAKEQQEYEKQKETCMREAQIRYEKLFDLFYLPSSEQIIDIFFRNQIQECYELSRNDTSPNKFNFSKFIDYLISEFKTSNPSRFENFELQQYFDFFAINNLYREFENNYNYLKSEYYCGNKNESRNIIKFLYLQFIGDSILKFYHSQPEYTNHEKQTDFDRNVSDLKRTQMFSHLKEHTNLQFKIEYLCTIDRTISTLEKNCKNLIYALDNDISKIFNISSMNFYDAQYIYDKYFDSNTTKEQKKELYEKLIRESTIFFHFLISSDYIDNQIDSLIDYKIDILQHNIPNYNLEIINFLKQKIKPELKNLFTSQLETTNELICSNVSDIVFPSIIQNDGRELFKQTLQNTLELKQNQTEAINGMIINIKFKSIHLISLYNLIAKTLESLNNKYFQNINQMSCLLDYQTPFQPFVQKYNYFCIVLNYHLEQFSDQHLNIIMQNQEYIKCLDQELDYQSKDIYNIFNSVCNTVWLYSADELKEKLHKDLILLKKENIDKLISLLDQNLLVKINSFKDEISTLNNIKIFYFNKPSIKSRFNNVIFYFLEKFYDLQKNYRDYKDQIAAYQSDYRVKVDQIKNFTRNSSRQFELENKIVSLSSFFQQEYIDKCNINNNALESLYVINFVYRGIFPQDDNQWQVDINYLMNQIFKEYFDQSAKFKHNTSTDTLRLKIQDNIEYIKQNLKISFDQLNINLKKDKLDKFSNVLSNDYFDKMRLFLDLNFEKIKIFPQSLKLVSELQNKIYSLFTESLLNDLETFINNLKTNDYFTKMQSVLDNLTKNQEYETELNSLFNEKLSLDVPKKINELDIKENESKIKSIESMDVEQKRLHAAELTSLNEQLTSLRTKLNNKLEKIKEINASIELKNNDKNNILGQMNNNLNFLQSLIQR
ncbi:MAG: hypothetical protein Q8784_00285 [Vigna little leaf phytoplasma]|nr:hypothetical protein [Vigna little leaf phytoplasma]